MWYLKKSTIAEKCNIGVERPQTLSNSITNPEKGLLQTQARQILMSILDRKIDHLPSSIGAMMLYFNILTIYFQFVKSSSVKRHSY